MKWNSDFVSDSSRKIHYYSGEANKPPVILLHGVLDNGLCWIHTANKLSEKYSVIMPDARGHGFTEISEEEPLSHDLMADDVAFLIQKLGLKNVQLIGHSMGAGIAALVAAKYPGLINKVILEDPGFRFEGLMKFAKGFTKLILKIMVRVLTKGTYEELLKKAKKHDSSWPEETYKPWVESKMQYREKNKRYVLGLVKSPYNWKEIVQTIGCPLLLISSSKGITNDKNAKKVMELCKKGKWVKIEGAGHNIRREQSEKFMETILDFLD